MDASIWRDLLLTLFDGVEFVGPAVVGIITVPLFSLVKRYLSWVDKAPAWTKQILVVVTAGVLTYLGSLLNVVLPTDVALFGEPEVSALLSAAMAYGIHAGKKAAGGGNGDGGGDGGG